MPLPPDMLFTNRNFAIELSHKNKHVGQRFGETKLFGEPHKVQALRYAGIFVSARSIHHSMIMTSVSLAAHFKFSVYG
jgi:hypothetical protein